MSTQGGYTSDLMSLHELCKRMGVSVTVGYRLAEDDALPIPVIRVGRQYKFSRSAWEAFLQETSPDAKGKTIPVNQYDADRDAYTEVVTIPELCQMLRIGRRTAYRMLSEQEIPARRLGRRWIISREAVNDWLKREEDTTPTFLSRIEQSHAVPQEAARHGKHTQR